MRTRTTRTLTGCTLAVLVLGAAAPRPHGGTAREGGGPRAVVGHPARLAALYAQWKSDRAERGARLEVALVPTRLAAGRLPGLRGSLALDLGTGEVAADVAGAPDGLVLESRLAPRHGARSLGALTVAAGSGRLEARLDAADLAALLDGLALGPPGEEPWLVGTPTLFQRLLAGELTGGALGAGVPASSGAAPAAATPPGLPPAPEHGLALQELVAQGERLFFEETFAGNGRTCGTCHPAENDLTIDAEFIATRPPRDPLFVAEFTPELDAARNGGRHFENPALMRALGLILVNADGFDDLEQRFVMRSVPHLFGLSQSIRAGDGLTPPDERVGWSGDGAPVGVVGEHLASGRLRDFALGAVVQHFPRTLARLPGRDFRLPTVEELDALEAFQLSLGRQGGFDLFSLVLFDPEAQAGLLRYRTSTCNSCHRNAGAGSLEGENINVDTGIEELLIANPDGTGEPRPVDGGFGLTPFGAFPPVPVPNADGGFGNGAFSVPTLVAFADTLPAFHNNTVDDVEASIEFYASDEFQGGAGFKIEFTPTEVAQVGRFLRAINAMDNLDRVRERLEAARALLEPARSVDADDLAAVDRALVLAGADLADADAVLDEVGMHPGEVRDLRVAKALVELARAPRGVRQQRAAVEEALALALGARDAIGLEP